MQRGQEKLTGFVPPSARWGFGQGSPPHSPGPCRSSRWPAEHSAPQGGGHLWLWLTPLPRRCWRPNILHTAVGQQRGRRKLHYITCSLQSAIACSLNAYTPTLTHTHLHRLIHSRKPRIWTLNTLTMQCGWCVSSPTLHFCQRVLLQQMEVTMTCVPRWTGQLRELRLTTPWFCTGPTFPSSRQSNRAGSFLQPLWFRLLMCGTTSALACKYSSGERDDICKFPFTLTLMTDIIILSLIITKTNHGNSNSLILCNILMAYNLLIKMTCLRSALPINMDQ